VSSVGFVAECESEDVAQKVGTIILFKCVHSGDLKSASEKMLAAHNFPAEHFYSPCTVQRTQNVCPQLSPAHKRKSTE
jgi:hypothetical protein